MKKNNDNKKDYLVSSGNLFADLGFPDAEERHAKLELAVQINGLIKKKKLTQKAAAELLDIDQPKVSALYNGRLSGFSLERLFRFLTILGQDVTIKVAPKRKSKPKAVVTVSLPVIKKVPAIKPSTSSTTALRAKKKAKTK